MASSMPSSWATLRTAPIDGPGSPRSISRIVLSLSPTIHANSIWVIFSYLRTARTCAPNSCANPVASNAMGGFLLTAAEPQVIRTILRNMPILALPGVPWGCFPKNSSVAHTIPGTSEHNQGAHQKGACPPPPARTKNRTNQTRRTRPQQALPLTYRYDSDCRRATIGASSS